ncbi:MAG TPA: hypothetical protein VIH85_18795 [Solirubrobacteraceae bacterium]
MRTTRGKRNLSSGATRRLINLKALLDRWRDAYRSGRKAPQIAPQSVTGDADARPSEPPPLPDERSEALAALCDRFLEELGGSEIKAAEIRFVVHKRDDPASPPADPDRDPVCGEVAWELRRLIASAGDTLADAVRGLERHAADLDENGRELLQDELTTLDVDLGLLKEHLADPTDWDSELECLLAGEIGPFDDPHADEDDDDDE